MSNITYDFTATADSGFVPLSITFAIVITAPDAEIEESYLDNPIFEYDFLNNIFESTGDNGIATNYDLSEFYFGHEIFENQTTDEIVE